MKIENVFADKTDDELFEIYKDILKGNEEGLRPEAFTPYIKQVREAIGVGMSVFEGWKMVNTMFYEEVAKRFFSKYSK